MAAKVLLQWQLAFTPDGEILCLNSTASNPLLVDDFGFGCACSFVVGFLLGFLLGFACLIFPVLVLHFKERGLLISSTADGAGALVNNSGISQGDLNGAVFVNLLLCSVSISGSHPS
ncbi:hypothetical protein L6164_017067 [Bauhinia variegata]|uniref:Uncharacterized protein n=1 Tax=Bauhinia variegata TaxID=167791 RepID=A0ACB9N7W9_BAUVA|nr:hypothetical protein L6164_017067 [Bauhinia variegata]